MHHVLLIGRSWRLVRGIRAGDTVGAVWPVRTISRRLDHWRQLQLLVVLLVALLSGVALVSLASAQYLLVQLHALVGRVSGGSWRWGAATVVFIGRRRDLVPGDAAQLVIAIEHVDAVHGVVQIVAPASLVSAAATHVQRVVMIAPVHDRVTGVVFAGALALRHRMEVMVAARLVRALPLPRIVVCRAQRVESLVRIPDAAALLLASPPWPVHRL